MIYMAFVLLTLAFAMLTAAHHRIDKLEAKVKALCEGAPDAEGGGE